MEPASEQDKRRRSSDGTTPKPKQKQVKMASGEHSYNAGDILDRMTIIAEAIEGLQKGQSKLQSTLDSKLDKFRKDFMSNIDDKFKAMKVDFELELGKQQAQIDTMSQTVASIVKRLDRDENLEREKQSNNQQKFFHEHDNRNYVDDPEITIIVNNIEQESGEDILEIASELIYLVNDSVKVVAAKRLTSRITGKPGLVKISLSNLEEKKMVLREKRKLKEVERYKKVFLRGSKSHTDRILELNARTLLDELPHGDQFRVTSNGRIVKKTQLTRPHGRIVENTTPKQRDERSSLDG